jgi:hypothetical protein
MEEWVIIFLQNFIYHSKLKRDLLRRTVAQTTNKLGTWISVPKVNDIFISETSQTNIDKSKIQNNTHKGKEGLFSNFIKE